MQRKWSAGCAVFFFYVTSVFAAPPQVTAKLDVAQPTGIPGATLTPGAYTIRVVDHLSDRYILRVDGPGSESRQSFLGIPTSTLKGGPGKIVWSQGTQKQTYLKGWNFAGTAGVLEFVYPKDEAVAIAKANGAHVAAIDPESEGRTSNGLSKQDMQMVTLWLLSPTRVGPGDASGGIKAERYAQVAKVTQRPVVAALPHTASNLALVELAGTLAFAAAAGLRLGRRKSA